GRAELAVADHHAEIETGNIEHVIGLKSRPPNALAIDLGPVRASQVTQEQQAIRFGQHAMDLGNALVVQANVAAFLSAHQGEVLGQIDGAAALHWHELRTHNRVPAPVGRVSVSLATAREMANLPSTISPRQALAKQIMQKS